jgi:hypothetical protein
MEMTTGMQDPDPSRRTALKLLALLGAGAVGSSGAAAAYEHHHDDQRDERHPDQSTFFVAHLRPQEGVETTARGMAMVQERHDGVKFIVHVSNLENTIMGHIHEDEALGPIAVWLYDFETQDERLEEGQFSGILDVGAITDEVIAEGRAPEAETETIEDLLGKINAGEAYVNIHTEEYPGGEIAGLLAPVDPVTGRHPDHPHHDDHDGDHPHHDDHHDDNEDDED